MFAVSSYAVVGSWAILVEGANFGGLSGVVYALVGYLWVVGAKAPQLGLGIPRQIVGFMLRGWHLGTCSHLWRSLATAHLAGLAAGVIIGFVDSMKAPKSAKKLVPCASIEMKKAPK
ncbi:rhomboid family intramembrane serine protease [Vibrio chagasii]|nr:rhomboid family intramembrane serine protease [Vibrio chagasii]